ncbi:MAG: cytochrome-c oxidase, cbb3-type subunit III [Kiloniellales bacterium]|nr:cytochrome-c oxidase, cbb3-type subunit III [Kiloniellales bacterium]
MPTKVEKDAITGTDTTGHEWDGIKELNTPLPKWWLYTFYATVLFSAVYVVLYPAIPGISSYTKGVLDWSRRAQLEGEIIQARERQGEFRAAIAERTPEEIRSDDNLLSFALAGGNAAFADNCAACHAAGGAGRPGGYPILADDDWIWGGTLDDIQTTLFYGIRANHEDTRESEMPAFGEILEREQILAMAEYVKGMSNGTADAGSESAEIFAEQCAACHGEAGEGVRELGGPRLNDNIWLYGGEVEQIAAQISWPKLGVMPHWLGRLDEDTIKMLTVYVHSLGGGE